MIKFTTVILFAFLFSIGGQAQTRGLSLLSVQQYSKLTKKQKMDYMKQVRFAWLQFEKSRLAKNPKKAFEWQKLLWETAFADESTDGVDMMMKAAHDAKNPPANPHGGLQDAVKSAYAQKKSSEAAAANKAGDSGPSCIIGGNVLTTVNIGTAEKSHYVCPVSQNPCSDDGVTDGGYKCGPLFANKCVNKLPVNDLSNRCYEKSKGESVSDVDYKKIKDKLSNAYKLLCTSENDMGKTAANTADGCRNLNLRIADLNRQDPKKYKEFGDIAPSKEDPKKDDKKDEASSNCNSKKGLSPCSNKDVIKQIEEKDCTPKANAQNDNELVNSLTTTDLKPHDGDCENNCYHGILDEVVTSPKMSDDFHVYIWALNDQNNKFKKDDFSVRKIDTSYYYLKPNGAQGSQLDISTYKNVFTSDCAEQKALKSANSPSPASDTIFKSSNESSK